MADQVTIRPGGPADVPAVLAVLAMLDLASDWLVARGRTGQWGTQRQSTDPRRQAQAAIWGDSGGLHPAMLGGVPVGALVVGLPVNFAPPPAEPDLYVNLLVTDRRYAGRGICEREERSEAESRSRERKAGPARGCSITRGVWPAPPGSAWSGWTAMPAMTASWSATTRVRASSPPFR